MDVEDLEYLEPEQAASASNALPAPDDDVPPPQSGPKAVARLIEYARGRCIALPTHTTYALIENPEAAPVPGAASHAYGLLTWQDMRLPMIDVNALLHADSGAKPASAPRYALIVAYQRQVLGPLAYGAIGLSELPYTVLIGDEAQCALPTDSGLWPLLALSCFLHEGQAVPILNTTRLFAAHG